MTPPKTTPMFEQYLAIKAEYPDAILFFRMGDFYEMFFEDAQTASKALEIALTSRNKNDAAPVPMCGVPHHAADTYIARMIQQGYKVAVCDQVEDPASAKGLVKREVVRVVTPAMVVDQAFLDAKANNFVCALTRDRERFGLAYLDISTGIFAVTETPDLDAAIQETLRLGPRELLMPDDLAQDPAFSGLRPPSLAASLTYMEQEVFDPQKGHERLLEQFRTASLEGFGCENLRAGLGAAGALLHYAQHTQKQEIRHIGKIAPYSLDAFLWIDEGSIRNLELVKNLRTGGPQGTLLAILDATITSMGGRLLRQWLRQPLLDPEVINARLDAVEEAVNHSTARDGVRRVLASVYDLERLRSRIVLGQCNGRDLLALKNSLRQLPDAWSGLACFASALLRSDALNDPLSDVVECIEEAVSEEAPATIREGGIIKQGFDPELDELIRITTDTKGWILALEGEEKKRTGIASLKVRFNKVFGYYIEVPQTQSRLVPEHYVRKQTLVNAERYITDELKTFETKILGAEERRTALEYELFCSVRDRVAAQSERIGRAAAFLALADVVLALADVADQNGYKRPRVDTGGGIALMDARHPVVEKMLSGQRFVPNSIVLDDEENQVLIITGPNMAGKSTVLRQVALGVIMAQMGSFVPAREAVIGVVDRIFTRVGALDNLSQGQSTFMVEMQETANILNNATPRSLVIMDEIGRGTSTFDGLSIAWAVAEYLHDHQAKGVKTLFATHYHELTDLSLTKERVKNWNIAVKEWNDEVIFLRKLVKGGTNRSYGIQVARLAGIPAQVVERAKQVLRFIEESETARVGRMVRLESKRPRAAPLQRSLFPAPEEVLVEGLKELDIANMTPVQALTTLDCLQRKVRALSGDGRGCAQRKVAETQGGPLRSTAAVEPPRPALLQDDSHSV